MFISDSQKEKLVCADFKWFHKKSSLNSQNIWGIIPKFLVLGSNDLGKVEKVCSRQELSIKSTLWHLQTNFFTITRVLVAFLRFLQYFETTLNTLSYCFQRYFSEYTTIFRWKYFDRGGTNYQRAQGEHRVHAELSRENIVATPSTLIEQRFCFHTEIYSSFLLRSTIFWKKKLPEETFTSIVREIWPSWDFEWDVTFVSLRPTSIHYLSKPSIWKLL